MVWNTPQSAEYKIERYLDKFDADEPCGACAEEHAETDEKYHGCAESRADRCSESRADKCSTCSRKQLSKGLFDDGDTLLIFGVLLILMREKADQKLLFALLIAMLM